MSAEEDPGLLGSLPRSRPGTRSAKRSDGVAAGAKAGGRAAGAQKAKAGPADAPPAPPAASASRADEQGFDPVGGALKGAARLAGAGLRVADGVTREVLRRLPRR